MLQKEHGGQTTVVCRSFLKLPKSVNDCFPISSFHYLWKILHQYLPVCKWVFSVTLFHHLSKILPQYLTKAIIFFCSNVMSTWVHYIYRSVTSFSNSLFIHSLFTSLLMVTLPFHDILQNTLFQQHSLCILSALYSPWPHII